jgi:hypothetical protein
LETSVLPLRAAIAERLLPAKEAPTRVTRRWEDALKIGTFKLILAPLVHVECRGPAFSPDALLRKASYLRLVLERDRIGVAQLGDRGYNLFPEGRWWR